MLVNRDDLQEALINFEKRNIFIKRLEQDVRAEYEEFKKFGRLQYDLTHGLIHGRVLMTLQKL